MSLPSSHLWVSGTDADAPGFDHRVDASISKRPVDVPAVIAEYALKQEPKTLGNPAAPEVLRAGSYLYSIGPQVLERKARERADGFRDVAVPGTGPSNPIADSELWDRPIDAMQTAPADEDQRILHEEMQSEVPAVFEVSSSARAILPGFHQGRYVVSPRHPRPQCLERLLDGLG